MPRLTFGINLALVSILVLAGCMYISMPTPLASYTPVSVESQQASGAPIYTQTCATSTCHGTQGEGIRSGDSFSAWPLVGSGFQSRHPNAQIVFDVVRSGGERNLLALPDQQIYDAIAYELSRNQITLKTPLTSPTAFPPYRATISGQPQGSLFPPSDNLALRPTPRDCA